MNTLVIALVLLTVYVTSSQAQFPFGPRFEISRYNVTEGQSLGVRLSASILTHSLLTTGRFSSLDGYIEVDICIEIGTELPLATAGSDYVLCDGQGADRFTVRFVLRQANSSVVFICIGDDNIFEDTEHFQLRICAIRFSASIRDIFRSVIGFDSVTAPVEIPDNDEVCIHWERNSVTVTEGVDREVELCAVAEGVYARPISIGVQCSSVDSTNGRPAIRDKDWSVTQTQLTFSSVDTLTSVSDLCLRAFIVNDSFAEPQESFLCNLQSGNADPVKAVPPTQITVTIVDNDELIISWERDFYKFRESETATVTLVTDSNFDSDVVVNGFPSQISENIIALSLPGPSLGFLGQIPATINNVDFRGVRYGVARVAGTRQESDVASTFDDFLFTSTVKRSSENFDIKNDSILECDELLRAEFSISNLLEDGWLARKGQFPICYIAIEDDDFVTVNFQQSEYRVKESAGQVTVSLEITGQFFKNVSAMFECINGSATDPLDWCNATTYTVNFNQTVTSDESPPAFTALSDPVYLTIKDDSLVEGDEVFLCRIVNTSDSIRVQIGPRNEVPVIIEDDDFAVCRYEEELYRVAEEAGYLEVALVLDQAALIPLSVNASTLFLLDDSVGDAASVVDFLSINELIITFPPNVTRVPFNITIIDDILPENSEFFNLDLNLVDGGGDSRCLQIKVGSPNQPLVEIFDSDAVVSISLDSTTYSIFENETRVIVTLQLSAPYTQDITVEVSLSENADLAELVRAVASVDFESSGFPRFVTIPAGQTSVSFPVLVIDEGIVEKDEGFLVSFSYTAGQPGVSVTPGYDQANITIKNDDELRVRFERELYTVSEDAGPVSVKIIASSTASFDYEVDIAISDISAVFPEDYSERQFNLSFPAGATNFIFEIPIVDDEVFEGTENFSLSIVIPQASADIGVEPGMPIRAFVDILDDEVVNVFFDPTSDIVTEGEDAELTVRADRDFTIPFSVIVTLSDDSAVAPGDYNSSQSPYVLTFQPGQSNQTILVPTNDDTTVEMTEMFTAALSLPAVNPTPGVVVIQPDEATVAILDNEEPLVVVLRRNETVPEGQDASVLVEVSSTDYEFDFTVTLSTVDDSAEAPADYQPGPYTASFTAGQASAVVRVGTEDDEISELTEHFKVTIDSTSKDRVVIGTDDTSFVTILDDDNVTCSFSVDSISVTEGESARVTIDISSADFSFPFTVTLSYMDGSAVEGEDYTSGNITVEFAPGQSSASFNVSTIDDDRVEKLESFKIMKVGSSRPDKVSPASPDMVTIEITDNDERTLIISPQNYTVVEGQIVNITLVLDSDEFDCEFNVTLVNTDMSATAPEDYTSGPYTVTFQPNQTTAVLMIPTEDDSIAELTEVFKVEISSTSIPAQILIGEPDDSYVTILDNDVIECSKAPENATVTEGEVAFLIIVCSGEYEFDFTLNLNSMDDSAVAPGDYIGGPYSTVFTAGQQSDILPVVTNDDSIAEMDQVFKVMITGSDRPDKVIIVQPDTCYVTIEDDDDVVTCQKAAENITVTEGQLVNVTIECSGEYEFDFTLDVATMDGSAFAPGDYEAGVMNVPFSAGEASRSVSGVTIDDSVIELEEFFKLTISGSDQGDKVVII